MYLLVMVRLMYTETQLHKMRENNAILTRKYEDAQEEILVSTL